MSIYDLLVKGSCHSQIIFLGLDFVDYEIYKYKYNSKIIYNLDNNLVNNLIQKCNHVMLNCNFKINYVYNDNVFNMNFNTFHTFTTKNKNSFYL